MLGRLSFVSFNQGPLKHCPVSCIYTEDHNDYNISSAVMFHIPTFSGFPKEKLLHHKWVVRYVFVNVVVVVVVVVVNDVIVVVVLLSCIIQRIAKLLYSLNEN
jgi:hypothetical protein